MFRYKYTNIDNTNTNIQIRNIFDEFEAIVPVETLISNAESAIVLCTRAQVGSYKGMELASRADQRVLRWFGHAERMDEYRMARRMLMAEVSGGRVRGRPRLGWMDGVKVALGNMGMTV